MNDIELTFREFYLYIVIGGAVIGALFGLVPVILGRRRGKARLGWYGLIASAGAGALAGPLLSIIVTGIFAWVITRENKNDAPRSSGLTGEERSAPE